MAGPSNRRPRRRKADGLHGEARAIRLVDWICYIAGSPDFLNEVRRDGAALRRAIEGHDTQAIFEWLVSAVSFQGISDRVAETYMSQHGSATWVEVETALGSHVECPKLKSHWHFHRCGYKKGIGTCSHPEHFFECPLPKHDLRNGRLNQTAYSLALFVRDVAGGDLVRWIDACLTQRAQERTSSDPDYLSQMREAVIGPMREIYGVSDKVLAMCLSSLLLCAPRRMPHWNEVGASMIAIDTLVHAFLHRTGILKWARAEHPYGPACYRPGGCAMVLGQLAGQIDARRFNPRFPATFPRFVQHAVWRYCAQQELDVCNGNRIDGTARCTNIGCEIYSICDRKRLKTQAIRLV